MLCVLVVVTAALLGLAAAGPESSSAEPQKAVIGAVEDVLLFPWQVTVRARVDTGAELSSIDARDIRIRDDAARAAVEFTLVGNGGRDVRVTLPLERFSSVRATEGESERRPVVRIEICLGRVRTPVQFTLNDRSRLPYRMLIGRNLLAGRFVVDVDRSLTVRPQCPNGG
jgi:hypothetical protein